MVLNDWRTVNNELIRILMEAITTLFKNYPSTWKQWLHLKLFSSFQEKYKQKDGMWFLHYAHISYNSCMEPTKHKPRNAQEMVEILWYKWNYVLTGILDVLKNSSRASSEPSVEACTYTPLSCSLMLLRADRKSRETSSRKISTSSDFWATWRLRPTQINIHN